MDKLTIEQLEALGVKHISHNAFSIPLVGEHYLHPISSIDKRVYDIMEVYDIIYQRAFERGIHRGQQEKLVEIQKVLGVYDNE